MPVGGTVEPQEVKTLPLGPEETGAVWYAQARLAFVTLSCKVWGYGVEGSHRWLTFVTRVMEKTALASVTMFEEMLSHLTLPGAKGICLWADAGSHFRANCPTERTKMWQGWCLSYRNEEPEKISD
eukprot:3881784-Lingulodinium_polyedra.AAC.1